VKLRDLIPEGLDDLTGEDELVYQTEKIIFNPKEPSDELRKETGYKRELSRLLPIVKKFGIKKAREINKAVRKYTATGYGRMNKSLRTGKLPSNASLIDQYIEIAPKFKGSKLFRGIGKDLFQYITSLQSKKIIEKAFMSVTKDRSTADSFANKGKGGILILTGALNKATQAPLPYMYRDGEAEFIFPRNTRLEIIKVRGSEIYTKVK